MIRAFLLLFNPVAAWDRVVEAKRDIMTVILVSLLPLLLLTQAGESYGLMHWGKQRGEFGNTVALAASVVLKYGVFQILLNLAVVFVGAFLVRAVGETFHGRHSYLQGFTVVAYGLSPYFLMRLLDALPREPWWLTWAFGIVLAASTLYTGIPHVMRPDPAHALGLYFISVLLLAIITGLAAFFGHVLLEQQFRASYETATACGFVRLV